MKQNPMQVRLDPDYECFAAELLRIRTKGGALVPLVFNRAQRHIHSSSKRRRPRPARSARSFSRAASKAARPMSAAATITAPRTAGLARLHPHP